MKIMPNNTPDVWTQIWTLLVTHFSNHNQLICGVVIAFFTSLIKSFLYGKRDTPKRVIAEALLCSLIAGSIQPILLHFQLSVDLITPIGAGIGLAGTSIVRRIILTFFNKRLGGVADDGN
ncbi:phage holin, lambda family [Rodentibacter caecimuris]|uniref:phage holin, lambda family n=1 Tax=Rodentibacter caecimuris TaxID=1796644 RepID=UPI00258AC982|nr:phage holin, lambda family [Rodentibacter heylii]